MSNLMYEYRNREQIVYLLAWVRLDICLINYINTGISQGVLRRNSPVPSGDGDGRPSGLTKVIHYSFSHPRFASTLMYVFETDELLL
jgi:hypothetical protein